MQSLATKAFLLMLMSASVVAATAENRHVRLKSRDAKDERPFSDAVRVGQTLYLAGRIGLDPATNKPPADAAAEVRTVMDQIKAVLAQEGMSMDDLVTFSLGADEPDARRAHLIEETAAAGRRLAATVPGFEHVVGLQDPVAVHELPKEVLDQLSGFDLFGHDP